MSKKNIYRAIAFVIVIYALSFFTRLPASLLQPLLTQQSEIKAEQITGTVWRGSINKFSIKYQDGYINIGQLDWRLKPLCFLTIRVCADLQLQPNAASNGDIHLLTKAQTGLNKKLTLQNTDLDLDASWVLEMAGAPISATGRINFVSEQLVLDQQQTLPMLDGILSWQQAGIDYPEEYELGNYIATISNTDDQQEPGIQAAISDENGLINTTGQIDIAANQQVNIDLKVAPNDSTPESLSSLLGFLGKPDREGRYKIRHKTSLKAIF